MNAMKSTPLFNLSLYLLNNKKVKRFTGKRPVISRCSIRTKNKMPTTVQKQQGGDRQQKNFAAQQVIRIGS
jgi:hypothetical protein